MRKIRELLCPKYACGHINHQTAKTQAVGRATVAEYRSCQRRLAYSYPEELRSSSAAIVVAFNRRSLEKPSDTGDCHHLWE